MDPKPVGLVLAKDSDLDGNESILFRSSEYRISLSVRNLAIQVNSDIWKDEES